MDEKYRMFVGNLSYSTTNDSLWAHFERYGELFDAVVINDHETGRSRGFGFVTFKEEEPYERCLSETHTLDGKMVDIRKQVSRENRGGFGGNRGGFGGNRGGFGGNRGGFGQRGGYQGYGGYRGGYQQGGGAYQQTSGYQQGGGAGYQAGGGAYQAAGGGYYSGDQQHVAGYPAGSYSQPSSGNAAYSGYQQQQQ